MQTESILSNMTSGSDSILGATGMTVLGLHFIYSAGNLESHVLEKPMGTYAVALPFVMPVHLLAIPKGKDNLLNLSEKVLAMQRVQLEGDYNSYFSLYSAQDEQIESRVVLDPAAMEYSVDFCGTYIWEIVNNTLYFASEGPLPDLKVIDDFVKKITPAAATSSAPVLSEQPQTIERLSPVAANLLCPVCSVGLHSGKNWLACPSGHGYFLTASQLTTTRRHMNDTQRAVEAGIGANPKVITPISTDQHGDLHCPNDGQILVKTNYQESTAFIYTCSACIFRWIDSQDLDTILGKYRNDGEDDGDDDGESELEDFKKHMKPDINVRGGFGRRF
jgi:Zn-finger nucleic acid-binding protein